MHYKLVKKCKKGSVKAQYRLYELYYQSMYNVALRFLGNTAWAEDVMQEAFLNAFDKINLFDERVTFGAWLKRIVVNKCIDELRKKKLNNTTLPANLSYTTNEEQSPNDIQQKVRLIKEGINLMSAKQKLLLTLNLLEGYDTVEIAEILEMKEGSVRTAIHRAKKRLAENLEKKAVWKF